MPLVASPADLTTPILTAGFLAMKPTGDESLMIAAIRDAIKAEIAAATGTATVTGTATGALAGGPGVPVTGNANI